MTTESSVIYIPTVEDVKKTSCREWFKSLEMFYENSAPGLNRFLLKTEFIALDDQFLNYLSSDGVKLPKLANIARNLISDCDPRFDSDEEASETSSESSDEENKYNFEELELKIIENIKNLGGKVFCKLNWTAPVDADWLTGSSCCQSSGEILLLLKSSDLVQHDLSQPFNHIKNMEIIPKLNYDLVLKKWANLNPAQEFRIYIAEGKMKLISQRHSHFFFEHLSSGTLQEQIREKIISFYEKVILPGFQQASRLEFYSFDIYIDKSNRIWLIDINHFIPFQKDGETYISDLIQETDLFHNGAEVLFKVVQNRKEADKFSGKYSTNKVPLELLTGDLSSETVRMLEEKLKERKIEDQFLVKP
eukprot:maker-scaffold_14-snap-gene-10.19-mRNA-1 protein AED:0.23 eAED:0.23 QI:121/1/1/1/1/1/2/28/361